jgi:hypothetical protein
MSPISRVASGLVAAILMAAIPVPFADAETVHCTPVRWLPANISRPGVYCLDRDLSTGMTGGQAINVDSNDVVLDLNGHTLDGSAAGLATEAVGIRSSGHANVTVRNGTVRGFLTGVSLQNLGGYGLVVHQIRADHNTSTGITVTGQGVIVRGNQVLATGGSTSPLGTRTFGIAVIGPGGAITGNLVSDSTTAGAYTYGIHAANSNGIVIEGNAVTNGTLPAGFDSYGILMPFSKSVVVAGNRITNSKYGIAFSSFAEAVCRENLISGAIIPYDNDGLSTAHDAGDNWPPLP